MLDKLDAQAVKAILAAEEESRRLGHASVDTEQLLLGLMADANSVATGILAKVGIKHQDVRRRMSEIIGRESRLVGVETPFAPRMKTLLDAAWTESQKCGKSNIGTIDLLAALCAVAEGPAWQILSESGVTPEKLKEEINKSQ